MSEAIQELDRLLRIGEVENHVGMTRSTIYRRIAEGSFPRPREIGGGQVRWRQSEVKEWQDRLPTTVSGIGPRDSAGAVQQVGGR
ncbi:helix-turn-helix transcriptional regulator [Roseomonas elaeocarpi]|uniref:Helix-turn-helix transcriptional regulator n=1 Tax=Roseomonas elaeocarpi TaxID=907779 RepID=A0ABV6JQH7_9PROT